MGWVEEEHQFRVHTINLAFHRREAESQAWKRGCLGPVLPPLICVSRKVRFPEEIAIPWLPLLLA